MTNPNQNSGFSRREWMQMTTAGVATAVACHLNQAEADEPTTAQKKGRIKQSMVQWTYDAAWPNVDEMCTVAKKLGLQSIELIDPEHWPTLKKHGLTCAIAPSHGFPTGFNNKNEWAECIATLEKRITECAEAGVKRVITFTGMANGLSKDEGAKNCVEGLKKIVGFAEKHDVMLCLEMLNTRDDSHPMKGHPGYQGDDCDYCIDILKQVGSDHAKLLFDVYHVQIMNGDVIRRIHQHKDYLGHIHTAGNPGRCEIDGKQEIFYPAVMQALVDVGYDGYVGHEFIPTRDAWDGLSEAVASCDV
ncbi:hydroxypyruvate isomerase family protein [Planctomicrobium sp. SH668]|uniref:hydroxypyruvate isomerase family protein n=1 Tax=Planctomicrobium sp. SH668 TaxID=3448126 RepID=UPI003F5C6266